MFRSLAALVLVTGLIAACGGQQATGAPSGAPVASDGAAASAPVASPVLTPVPTPTVKELAAAYLKAATAANKARDKAWATYEKSPQTLTHAKRLARAYAAAELKFIRAMQKIAWYGDYKALARRVMTPENQMYVACRSATIATTWSEWNDYMTDRDTAGTKMTGAANELRIALGLPPVPIK